MGETKTTTVLRMIWTTEEGKTAQWNLTNPNTETAKKQAVGQFMQEVISDEFILKDNSEAMKIKDSYIYQTNKIDLA